MGLTLLHRQAPVIVHSGDDNRHIGPELTLLRGEEKLPGVTERDGLAGGVEAAGRRGGFHGHGVFSLSVCTC